jgi:hypothetical protein
MTPSLGDALLPLLRILRGTRYWPISAGEGETASTARPAEERIAGATAFLATIGVGVGDDDTADTLAEREFSSSPDARTWIERKLPVAEFPAWVLQRPRGAVGAFLFGAVQRGRYAMDANGCVAWQAEEGSADDVEASLVEGQVRWRDAQGAAV